MVIIIKKLISRQIIQRIPKSNILPQPRNDQDKSLKLATLHSTPRIIQIGLINENSAGDLSLLCQSSSFQVKKWYVLRIPKKSPMKPLQAPNKLVKVPK